MLSSPSFFSTGVSRNCACVNKMVDCSCTLSNIFSNNANASFLYSFKGSLCPYARKPILRFKDGAVYACGTPWAGKEGENKNVMLPLKSVCILSRGKTNEIERVDFGRIYPLLIGQAYRPATENAAYTSPISGYINWK